MAAVEKKTVLKPRGNTMKNKGQTRCPAAGIPQRAISFSDKQKWKNIFMNEDVEACAFVYPFPDYRFPRVLLMDDFIASDIHSSSLLYRVLPENRDLDWQVDTDEFAHLTAVQESASLAAATCSFLILISSRALSIKRIAPFDFVHFSSEGRRLEYRTCTVKLQGEGRVLKRLLCPIPQVIMDSGKKVKIRELESSYERGPLVAALWRKACFALDSNEFESRFPALLRDYYAYVQQQAERHLNSAGIVDLLPSNLVVIPGQGQYRAIDQEWTYTEPFSTDFILFRALLWFGYHNRCSLATYRHAKSWRTVRDFVEYCFACLTIPLGSKIDEFVALEDGFHAEIALSGFSFSTWGVLEATL